MGMDGMWNNFCTVIIVLLQYLREGNAISCYTCSSRNGTDLNCHDPFNPAMSTYTEGCKVPKEGHIGLFPANFCIKIIGKTVTEEEHVIRACTLENMDNQCGVFRFEKDTLQGCILTCDYDGCNGTRKYYIDTSWILSFLYISYIGWNYNRS